MVLPALTASRGPFSETTARLYMQHSCTSRREAGGEDLERRPFGPLFSVYRPYLDPLALITEFEPGVEVPAIAMIQHPGRATSCRP